MKKYISLDDLTAEIEKRYEYWREKEFNSHSIESETRMSECQHLMLLLNTFEVKEIQEDIIRNESKTGAYWENKYKEILKQFKTNKLE